MLTQFFGKNDTFFKKFNCLGQYLIDIANHSLKLLERQDYPPEIISTILEIKQNAKQEAQNIFTLTHQTLITPFDRDDIHALNYAFSDAINSLNLTAQRIAQYEIIAKPRAMLQLAEIVYEASKHVAQAIEQLSNLKNHTTIIKLCDLIKAYESSADQLLIFGLAELYRQENDFKLVLKLKEIYDLLESVTDRYQRIAYIIEGIILEYA